MGKILTPDEITETGDQIYNEIFREKYESKHKGKFLAIDVANKTAHLGEYPEDAVNDAEKNNPNGNFYIVKIGAAAAFHMRHTYEQHNDLDWAFRLAL